MIYYYLNKETNLDLSKIHLDVANSEMIDKGIDWCRWDEDTEILEAVFINELNESDKSILDSIIQNN